MLKKTMNTSTIISAIIYLLHCITNTVLVSGCLIFCFNLQRWESDEQYPMFVLLMLLMYMYTDVCMHRYGRVVVVCM